MYIRFSLVVSVCPVRHCMERPVLRDDVKIVQHSTVNENKRKRKGEEEVEEDFMGMNYSLDLSL